MNELTLGSPVFSRWREFWLLTKPGVVQLIVFCAFIGMLLSLPQWPNAAQWSTIALASLGIWLVASAAAAINCLLESRIDAQMKRTAWRGTARGSLSIPQASVFAGLLGLSGSMVLLLGVNALTMWLTLATLLGYSVIYTLILKPRTPQNIVIGGASGAMPPVLGWTAMQGVVEPQALVLFLIIFVWTPPHFWALALYRVQDYRRSGLPMLPVTHGMEYTARHVFLYTIGLFLVCLLPVVLGMNSWLYLAVAMVMGWGFCWYAYGLWKNYSDDRARATFKWSLWHLSAIFSAMLLDHYLI